jgi:hypothetical protein
VLQRLKIFFSSYNTLGPMSIIFFSCKLYCYCFQFDTCQRAFLFYVSMIGTLSSSMSGSCLSPSMSRRCFFQHATHCSYAALHLWMCAFASFTLGGEFVKFRLGSLHFFLNGILTKWRLSAFLDVGKDGL